MEAKLVQSIQPYAWMDTRKMIKRPNGLTWVSPRTKEKQGIQMLMAIRSSKSSVCHKPLALRVSCSLKNSQGTVVESGAFATSLNESVVLKSKALEIEPYLDGRCIYLVGMMGSGKTTIGKIVSEALDYSFFDCDVLIEQTVGVSVAEIFKQHGEGFFRDRETEALQKLSSMRQLVVSTGGGAVIRPINWKHMQSGISVWLDVPIDSLARRISAVGTGSRPLLDGESGDEYSKAFKRLSTLFQERGEAYARASTRVSLEYLSEKLGHVEVDKLTPSNIAIEVLEQIESFLKEDGVVV